MITQKADCCARRVILMLYKLGYKRHDRWTYWDHIIYEYRFK